MCGLQVTDTKQTTIEVRALVSASDPGNVFDLRCEVREGLIEFLCRNHPESLPRQRNVNEPPEEETQHRQKSKSGLTAQGKEHERGPKTPGIRAYWQLAGASREGDEIAALEKQNSAKHFSRVGPVIL